MRYVLAIDPGGESGKGGETGIALGQYGPSVPYQLVDYWAIPAGVDAFMIWFKRHTQVIEQSTVICENFITYKANVDFSPLKLIGAVQALIPDAILQAPQKRLIITPDQLKLLDAYIPGGHHRDVTEAIRHGVAWLVKDQKHMPTQKVVLT